MLHELLHLTVDPATLTPPFYLIVVDYDSRRYALEGPVCEIVSWEKEVTRIRRAGRDVWSFPVAPATVAKATEWFNASGFEEWPRQSIVEWPQGFAPALSQIGNEQ